MPITLLEVGGGVIGLGIVAYIATRQAPQGTGVVFSSPNPTAVAAITSSNASNFSSLQGAITARSAIGAQLALGLAQLDTNNRANALAASSADKTTAANLKTSLGAQATQYKIAAGANTTTNYGVAMTASRDVKLATLSAQSANYAVNVGAVKDTNIAVVGATAADYQASVAAQSTQNVAQLAAQTTDYVANSTNKSNVQIAGIAGTTAVAAAKAGVQIAQSQATASVGIAQVQGAAQTAIASSQAQAQEVAAQQQQQAQTNAANAASSASKSASMWGGIGSIASLATAFL